MTMATLIPSVLIAALGTCGWLGLELSSPDVMVRGPRVGLAEPLRIQGVEDPSPAAGAGLAAGMQILAIDGEPWDGGSFLENLVRLQTVAPGDRLSLRVSDGSRERTVRLRSEGCDAEQERQRATLRAELARMEGAAWSRFHGHPAAFLEAVSASERQALEAARLEYERAVHQMEEYVGSPEARDRFESALQEAQASYLESLNDPEVRRRLEGARAAYDQATAEMGRRLQDDASVRRALEDAMRQLRRAGAAVSPQAGQWEEAQRQFEDAVRAAAAARALDESRADRDDLLAERYRDMALLLSGAGRTDPQRMLQLMELVERQTEQTAGLLERRTDLQALREALQAPRSEGKAMGLEEESLRRLRERLVGGVLGQRQGALENLDRLRADRTLAEAQRALEAATLGRDLRTRALLAAAGQVAGVREAAEAIGAVELQAVGPGMAGYVGVRHGLLVERIDESSPLAAAGVVAGDVLLSVEGRRLEHAQDLLEWVRAGLEKLRQAGESEGVLVLEVNDRSGRRDVELSVRLRSRGTVGPI